MPVTFTCECGTAVANLEALDLHQTDAHRGRSAPRTSFEPHPNVEPLFVSKCRSCGITLERRGQEPPALCLDCYDHGPGCDGMLNCTCTP